MPAEPPDDPEPGTLARVLAVVLALGLAVGLPAVSADAVELTGPRTPAGPAVASVSPASSGPGAEVARTLAELDAVTARAAALAEALEREAARDGGLRQALADLAAESDEAQARLDARVRRVFVRGGRDPLDALALRLGAPGLGRAAQQGLAASVRAERELVDAASAQSAHARALRARAAAHRARLRSQAAAVLAEQDRARALLTAARAAAQEAAQAAQAAQAVVARQASARQASAREALAVQASARLDVVARRLDDVSAAVTTSLSPAQTARGRRAQEREAPLLVLAEAAGGGYPTGWAPTGAVVRGPASWYGPGFVGSPTASGAPYDPEQLSCAHKELPLGTLLRVSRGGRAVVCLVNDRGPYAGDRVLDLSRAGSRALGYDGTAEVAVEVLAPLRPAG